jgi:hypothetical protein
MRELMRMLGGIGESWLMGPIAAVVVYTAVIHVARLDANYFLESVASERESLETKLREADVPAPQVGIMSESLDNISWRTRSFIMSLQMQTAFLVALAFAISLRTVTKVKKVQDQLKEIKLRQVEQSAGPASRAQNASGG